MPIYAYRCEACGHAKDVLQKMADPVLSLCPACGTDSFRKQLTAAGFQLKGSGWYATDFRHGGARPATADAGEVAKPSDPAAPATPATPAAPATDTAADRSGPAAAAGGCGTSCACH